MVMRSSNTGPTKSEVRRAQELYHELETRAVSDGENLVWSGSFNDLFAELGQVTHPMWYVAKRHLIQADCITQVARGGNAGPSIVWLLKKPVVEDLRKLDVYTPQSVITGEQRKRDFAEEIRRIQERLDVIEERLGIE